MPRDNIKYFGELIALDLEVSYLELGDYFYDTILSLGKEEYASHHPEQDYSNIADFFDEGLVYRAILKIKKDFIFHRDEVRRLHRDEELRRAGTSA